MRKLVYFFTLLAFTSTLFAKDKPTLPQIIMNARYVLVTTYSGDDPANPQMMPDDRRAIADVQDAIRKWGRYALAYERKNADLIILVRKGRYAEALAGVRIHADSQRPNASIGPAINGDAGDPQDMLTVYDAAQGIDSPPLWRGRALDGLKPPQMNLVKQLRVKVEASEKKP